MSMLIKTYKGNIRGEKHNHFCMFKTAIHEIMSLRCLKSSSITRNTSNIWWKTEAAVLFPEKPAAVESVKLLNPLKRIGSITAAPVSEKQRLWSV